jgi:aminopeptidase N
MNILKSLLLWLMIIISTGICSAQTDIYDSGGPLMPEQASYDVRFYDLALTVNPSDSSIAGSVQINADIVQPIDQFVVDLDTLLTIHKIVEVEPDNHRITRRYHREVGKIWVYLGRTRQPGEHVKLIFSYGGKPRVARRPPWDGGFTWAQTQDGSPWIATTCQGEGSDIWWPSKDHVSDEPDSMGIHIRVPQPLFCASNGRLRLVESHDDSTRTMHWFVSTPINSYNVALNIAPYELIEDIYQSTAGESIAVQFWVLPEDFEKGKAFLPEIKEHLRFFEETIGPYPFRADKYGVVQTPHLGMEHQTIIAYGANFDNAAMSRRDWGYDALHHHELSHEWWGNLVTCQDWRDMWLHEGFATYMQALYLGKIKGMYTYHSFMASIRAFENNIAVAPRKSLKASEIWSAPIYAKGAWVLHSLRYLIGDEALRLALRRMAYPNPAMEKITNGRQVRFATTDDFLQIAEQVSGRELDWFFEIYLRQTKLPELVVDLIEKQLNLFWNTPMGFSFPMPIDVKLDDKIIRVEIPDGGATVPLDPGVKPEIDPQHWILFNLSDLISGEFYTNKGDYPKARASYKKVLQFDPSNNIALKMIKHLDYAEKNVKKINSDFFNPYLGKYQITPNYIQTVTKEQEGFYIQESRRGKHRIYPLSDNEFILSNFDVSYIFLKSEDGRAEELLTKSPGLKINRQAKRIE